MRILLLEDDNDARLLVHEALVACRTRMTRLRETTSVVDCCRLLDEEPYDLFLADLHLPDGSGIDAIRHACALETRPTVLVISSITDEDTVTEAILAGASGYVCKHDNPAEIARSIDVTEAGGSCISPTIALRLMEIMRRQGSMASEPLRTPLTDSERTVLQMAAQGHNYRKIAQIIGVQPSTVYTHVRHIYEKLQVSNLAQALFEARRQRLV